MSGVGFLRKVCILSLRGRTLPDSSKIGLERSWGGDISGRGGGERERDWKKGMSLKLNKGDCQVSEIYCEVRRQCILQTSTRRGNWETKLVMLKSPLYGILLDSKRDLVVIFNKSFAAKMNV